MGPFIVKGPLTEPGGHLGAVTAERTGRCTKARKTSFQQQRFPNFRSMAAAQSEAADKASPFSVNAGRGKLSARAKDFGASVIVEMSRLAQETGAVNLAEGEPVPSH